MTIKPVADLYLITYEDGTPYKSTRDAKEAIDAIGAGFKVEEFVGIEILRALMLQGKAERVSQRDELPEGWVAVPVDPTKEMIDAGWMYFMGVKNPSSKGTYKAMLAVAPRQEVK